MRRGRQTEPQGVYAGTNSPTKRDSRICVEELGRWDKCRGYRRRGWGGVALRQRTAAQDGPDSSYNQSRTAITRLCWALRYQSRVTECLCLTE